MDEETRAAILEVYTVIARDYKSQCRQLSQLWNSIGNIENRVGQLQETMDRLSRGLDI